MIAQSPQSLKVKLSCLALHLRVHMKRYRNDSIPFRSKRVYFGRLSTTVALIDEIWCNGEYTPLCKEPPSVILDVGANIGISILWWRNLFPQANVVAVEPDPASACILRRNVASWGMADSVSVLESALAGVNGPVTLFSHAESVGETTNSIVQLTGSTDEIRTLICDGVTLTRLMERHRPQLVKIDIEGGEYEPLEQWLSAGMPGAEELSTMFIEFHDRPDRAGGPWRLIQQFSHGGFVARSPTGQLVCDAYLDQLPATVCLSRRGTADDPRPRDVLT